MTTSRSVAPVAAPVRVPGPSIGFWVTKAVAMVGVFGTMAADVVHVVLGLP